MKILSVLSLLVLAAGCSVSPSMQELETQAFLSGDWSAVEKRERTLVRRQLRAGIQCPPAYIGYCEERGIGKACTCVERDAIRLMFGN